MDLPIGIANVSAEGKLLCSPGRSRVAAEHLVQRFVGRFGAPEKGDDDV